MSVEAWMASAVGHLERRRRSRFILFWSCVLIMLGGCRTSAQPVPIDDASFPAPYQDVLSVADLPTEQLRRAIDDWEPNVPSVKACEDMGVEPGEMIRLSGLQAADYAIVSNRLDIGVECALEANSVAVGRPDAEPPLWLLKVIYDTPTADGDVVLATVGANEVAETPGGRQVVLRVAGQGGTEAHVAHLYSLEDEVGVLVVVSTAVEGSDQVALDLMDDALLWLDP